MIRHIPSPPHSVQLSHAGVEKHDAQHASELFVENVFSTTQPFCLSQSVEPANEVPVHCSERPRDRSKASNDARTVNRILLTPSGMRSMCGEIARCGPYGIRGAVCE